MSYTQFEIGDKVCFHGEKSACGKLLIAYKNGPATFTATINSILCGNVYSLAWNDGSPVGIPFMNKDLIFA